MAVRAIVVYPHPVLTTPTREVETVDDDLRALVDDMIETMRAERGVGLAANQVGQSVRLMVVDVSAGEDPEALTVLVNPRVVETSGRQNGEEGCLSFPGIFENITRPQRVVVEATRLDGQSVRVEGEDFFARALLHEIDHLDGIVFLQRMSPLKRRLVQRQIRRLEQAGQWPESVMPDATASTEG
ncbi:MAG TPA: peptide deformylase [Acidobacteria bacterium]|nr:peptide deformylase [Acidobacteriota bacterium]